MIGKGTNAQCEVKIGHVMVHLIFHAGVLSVSSISSITEVGLWFYRHQTVQVMLSDDDDDDVCVSFDTKITANKACTQCARTSE